MTVDTPINNLAWLAEQRLHISQLNWMPQQNGTMKLAVADYSAHEINEMIKNFARHNIFATKESLDGSGSKVLVVGEKSANIISEMYLEAELSTLDAMWQNDPNDKGLRSLLERREADLRKIRVENDTANVGKMSAQELLKMVEQSPVKNSGVYKQVLVKELTAQGLGILGIAAVAYETYQDAKPEIEQGKPLAAASIVADDVAKFTTGFYSGVAAAEAALPLLAFGPPGEVAYGATVLAAMAGGSELTKQVLDGAHYLSAKSREMFEAQKQERIIEAHIRDVSQRNGVPPEGAWILAGGVLGEKARQDENTNKNIAENDMPPIYGR